MRMPNIPASGIREYTRALYVSHLWMPLKDTETSDPSWVFSCALLRGKLSSLQVPTLWSCIREAFLYTPGKQHFRNRFIYVPPQHRLLLSSRTLHVLKIVIHHHVCCR